MRELQQSTGHAPGEHPVETEPEHEVPMTAGIGPVAGGPYTALISGGRPVFSVEKPPPGTRRIILALGLLATLAGVTLVVLLYLSSS
jgi:hypothetical protein